MTNKTALLPFPVLIGDIGGTNARFALIGQDGQEQQQFTTLKVTDFANIDIALETAILPQLPIKPKSLFLAIAGPVTGKHSKITNSRWFIDAPSLLERFNLESLLVINDFEAQALASIAVAPHHLDKIGNDTLTPDPYGARAILGPGTGIGIAGLVSFNKRYAPITGEGGHIDFAPRTPRDVALFPHLPKRSGRVGVENVLSGSGLIGIYRAICAHDGIKPQLSKAREITDAARKNSLLETQPMAQAKEAVTLFLTWLARLAGDFALIFKAGGGIYIGGGILPQILDLIDNDAFRHHFADKAPHNELLAQIPV